MKSSAFYKTIGFKLAMWYTTLLILFGIMMIVSVNLAMWQARIDIPRWCAGSNMAPLEVARVAADRYAHYLRLYSLFSFVGLVAIGGVGGYVLSKKMLKPVDGVTRLAQGISTSNLKERINYQGPDDEMKRLADTFDDMLGRLENAFESQKQFIQDASHELRTPIAIARTNIEVLEMEKKPTTKDYQNLVSVLKMSLERLSRLSDELLLLSRENQGQTKLSTVDVVPLLGEVVTEFSANARANMVNLQLEPVVGELLVRGDALYLKQAVINVIDNAIRYNRPGGLVKVSARPEAGQLVIKVQDSGIGISKADQGHIFDRFYRVDKSRSRAQGGSGLGLAITRKVIEGYGGKITVESTTDEGSTFTISLPLSS
jgi:signal transduction histidine kinase